MNKIGITAGHRGKGTGAARYLDEGAETIEFRDLLNEKLIERGAIVVMDNNTESLTQVINRMKKELGQYDLNLDIHFNAVASELANGTEVVVGDNYTPTEWQIAENILNATCSVLGTHNRGVKKDSQTPHKRLAMLRDFNAQQCLIEICFCTNKEDVRKYNEHKEELAEAIADILYDYAKK